jgi:hypothetical protein
MTTRYVIKGPEGGFFTEFVVKATRSITLNGAVVGEEHDRVPLFDAHRTRHAAKFDTAADAKAQIENDLLFHGGPEAFAGCTVQPTED